VKVTSEFCAASDVVNSSEKQREEPQKHSAEVVGQRYLPVGNNPEIALDTQTGRLCRTVMRSVDFEAPNSSDVCTVSEESKKPGFVPDGCKSGETRVLRTEHPVKTYADLPLCTKIKKSLQQVLDSK
jgi:hypothetical protein